MKSIKVMVRVLFSFNEFDLINWKLTLPIDIDGGILGKALDVHDLSNISSSEYFYTLSDGALIFRAPVDGATTPGSPYARSELREMSNGDKAAWTPTQDGVMTATLSVNQTPTKFDGTTVPVIVGQIHGATDELVRLYYDNGHVYFVCDYAGAQNALTIFALHNGQGNEPPDIALGDKFSYKIEVKDNTVSVTVYINGDAYSADTAINQVWQNDALYFKAGVYLGANETTATGAGETAFYGLDFSHAAGAGLGGLVDTGLSDTSVTLSGGSDHDVLRGSLLTDTLNGNDGDDLVNGYAGDDKLDGGTGDDIVNGGTGADTLTGGAGNDTFYVDNAGDVVSEASGDGTDAVLSTITYTLGSDVENLTLLGTNSISAIGNALANVLVGNDGDNVIFGDGGADTMRGHNGNDTYYVDNTGDVVIEEAGGGKDVVISSVSYTLRNNVESLSLLGTSALSGKGNGLNNTITGNAGNNKLYGLDGNDRLDGGAGNDTLTGGNGDDSYYVDASGDRVVELAGQGYDTVKATASFILSDNVEALYLQGTGNVNGTGNALANLITGNSGANIINGGLGNDTLQGGGGPDHFVFNTAISAGNNVDHIADVKSHYDHIDLDHLIFSALGAGSLADTAFAVGTAATTSDQHIIYDAQTGSLYYDSDGSGAEAQILFAVLDQAPLLAVGDFMII